MPEETKVLLHWEEGLRFEAQGERSGKSVKLDSPSQPNCAGPSPMELLLMGVAGCTAMDVVSILQKMREPLTAFTLEIVGQRVDTHPKYYQQISLTYHLWGEGLSREKVERAVQLSHQTYCSAMASLRPDCQISSRIELH